MSHPLNAEELLAGTSVTQTVEVPAALVNPLADGSEEGNGNGNGAIAGTVALRPLSLRDVQQVTRAAREQKVLTSLLMVQQSLVEPKLSVDQVAELPAGLVQFLLAQVNALSGLTVDSDELDRAVKAPVARACFVLAREFGWTPEECSELTVGQVLLYLEMLAEESSGGGA